MGWRSLIAYSAPMAPEKPAKARIPEPKPVRDPWKEAIGRIVRGEDADPFQILGPHWIERDGKRQFAIRVYRPGAAEAKILWRDGISSTATKIAPEGLFEAIVDPATA